MFGRMGALIGNILFPYLLAVGCLAPFMMVGIIMLSKYNEKMNERLYSYFLFFGFLYFSSK